LAAPARVPADALSSLATSMGKSSAYVWKQ